MLITAQPIPLTRDSNGVMRIAETRVTLDTVVAAFQAGAVKEQSRKEQRTKLRRTTFLFFVLGLSVLSGVRARLLARRAGEVVR